MDTLRALLSDSVTRISKQIPFLINEGKVAQREREQRGSDAAASAIMFEEIQQSV